MKYYSDKGLAEITHGMHTPPPTVTTYHTPNVFVSWNKSFSTVSLSVENIQVYGNYQEGKKNIY